MIRSLAAALWFFTLTACALAHPAFPQQPEPAKQSTPSESREKIIKNLQADFEGAFDRLNKNDPGAEAREKQKRIIAGLDKLLEQQNPNPPAGVKPQPPKGAQDKLPAPKSTVGEAEKQPSPVKKQSPAAKAIDALKDEKPIGKEADGSKDRTANTLEQMMKELKMQGEWSLPPRHREQIDTLSRERFPQRYEELLRAYYRTIAESNRNKDRE